MDDESLRKGKDFHGGLPTPATFRKAAISMISFWAKTLQNGRPGISVRDHCLNVGCVAEALIAALLPALKLTSHAIQVENPKEKAVNIEIIPDESNNGYRVILNGCFHSLHTDRGSAEQTRTRLIAEHAQKLFAAEQDKRAYPGHPEHYQAQERIREMEGPER